MGTRAEQKQASLSRILTVASKRLRKEGIKGAAISGVMKEAGLTHGAFYAHFENKEQLASAAFEHAIETTQRPWLDDENRSGPEPFEERIERLAASYLNEHHRDNVSGGCAISALASQIDDAAASFQTAYADVVEATIHQIAQDDPARVDDAIVFLSSCVGGLLLARATQDKALSKRILKTVRREAAAR